MGVSGAAQCSVVQHMTLRTDIHSYTATQTYTSLFHFTSISQDKFQSSLVSTAPPFQLCEVRGHVLPVTLAAVLPLSVLGVCLLEVLFCASHTLSLLPLSRIRAHPPFLTVFSIPPDLAGSWHFCLALATRGTRGTRGTRATGTRWTRGTCVTAVRNRGSLSDRTFLL